MSQLVSASSIIDQLKKNISECATLVGSINCLRPLIHKSYLLRFFLFFPDIVFIRTWYPVSVPNFYNPMTSLLLPSDQKENWLAMRSVGQLRKDLGLKTPINKDSLYKV